MSYDAAHDALVRTTGRTEATLVYAPGGYDAIRARALSIPSPIAQLTGPSGRLVFEGVRL